MTHIGEERRRGRMCVLGRPPPPPSCGVLSHQGYERPLVGFIAFISLVSRKIGFCFRISLDERLYLSTFMGMFDDSFGILN